MGDTEATSDYSGSLSSTTSSDESETEERVKKVSDKDKASESSLLWVGNGIKKCPLIIFRPESIISRERKLKSIGEKYHLSYKMVKTESKLVRSLLSAYGFHEVHPNSADFNLMWTGAHLKPFSLRTLQDFQKVNHFPRSYEITRKDRLYKNIERMAHTKGAKHFDFIPKSYLMPSEYQEFCAAFVKEKGSWIVKPIASSRGRGIYLINNPNQVPLEDNIMVCRYISNPLLVDGFKFDIRVYVAVTSYDPLLVYLFEEGLTRFATVKYEKTNRHLKNQMMHLTNYSINKKSHDYVRCEDPDVEDYGNKWSMSAMLRYLKQEGIDTAQLMVKIEAVIIKSILAAELPIATACKMFVPHKENCIELYGFDILVDENLKPWILEGNLSPSLACDAPLDLKIKSSMVADFFSLAGFNCIDPMTRKQNKKHLDVMRRPYSASKTASAQNAGSNLGTAKRPSSAATVPKDVSSGGLSSEEAKVLKMAKEQYQRRGSFVRIFPTAESWEQYGSFLEYKSSLNHMLAQKLFPDLSYSSKSSTGAYSSAVARMKNVAANQLLEGRHHLVAARSMQYERKLLSLESCKKKRHAPHRKSKHPTPVGVDTKKSTNHVTSSSSSSRRLYGNDEDSSDEETTATTTNYSSKTSTGISKPSRPISTASGATGEGKLPRAPAKRLPSAHAGSKDPGSVGTGAKQPAGAATLGRKPSQRVYMYKTDAGKDKGEISGRKTPSISANGKQQSIESQKSIPRASDAQNPADEVSSSGSDSERSKDTASSSTGASAAVGAAGSRAKATATPIVQGGKNKGKASFDVLEMLKAGRNLGKIQARQAFSSYLSKVQQRLMTESDSRSNEGSEVVAKQEEQMDLVLRFLKRAAANLRQPFSVVVPSRRLSLHDRKRILAKQLGDFVHVYNKETEGMEHKNQLGLHKETSEITLRNGDRMVEDSQFRSFMVGASELSLEEVLTAYTHKNKSASVFLGASKPKTPHIRSPSSEKSSAGGQQSGEGNMLHKTGSGGMPPNHYSHTSSQIFLPSDQASSASDHVPSPSSSSHSSHSYSHFSSGSSHGLSGMSSMQQAALVYGAKLHSPKSFQSQRRPASAKPFSQNSVHMQQSHQARPVSASCRPLGNNLHYQSSSNHEKLADALQKLTEKQAARKYSAPVQLTTLTQHLSSLNLSSMDSMQRNHQAITNSNSARQGNLAKKSASLCDLATFDPSVQSMVDPAQHGKFTVLRGSPTAKYGSKKNPGDPDQPLQHNALGHHSIMSQGESRDGEKNFNEMLRVQIFSRALASKQDEQKNLLKLQIINFFAAEAAQKQQQKGSSGAKGGHGSIQAIYNSLFAVGELPSKQCKKQFRQKLRKTKSANVQKVGKGKRWKKSDNLGSAQTRGAAYDKGRERLAGNPLQLLTKPPSIPRRPEPPKLNERPLQTRKLNARAINDYDVQSSMGPDFYTSLKYDSQTGSTRTYERQLSETSSNGSRKHTWKP